MFTPMIISFRECMEIFVLLIPLLAYVHKVGRKDLAKKIYLGSLCGFLASIAVAYLIFSEASLLKGMGENVFKGGIMIFISILLIYSVIILRKQKSVSFDNIEAKVVLTGFGIFLLSFLTVLREFMEITIFILASIGQSIFLIIAGVIIGLLLAFSIVLLIYRGFKAVRLNVVFTVLNYLMIIIGALMLGEGASQLFPTLDSSFITGIQLLYVIPSLYLMVKSDLKTYIKKNLKK